MILIDPYRFKANGGGGFTDPTDISDLHLWLDGDDAATITESSGAVSQWDDKSGNDNHATQGTASNQPQTGGSIDGVNALDFAGSNDHLNLPGDLIRNVPGVTIFFVAQTSEDSHAVPYVLRIDESNGDPWLFIRGSFGGEWAVNARRVWSDGVSAALEGGDSTPTRDTIVTWHVDYQNADRFLRQDGSQVASGTSRYSGGNSEDDTGAAHLGSTGSGNGFGGLIGEVILYKRFLTGGEVGQVETYLSGKWGVTLA